MISFKETLEKLENSKEFKEFKKENPSAFLTTGFFVVDNEAKTESKQLDFATSKGEEKELVTFLIGEKIEQKKEETIKKEKFNRIEIPKIELNDALEIMKKETEKISQTYSKIIAILQMIENEGKSAEIWNLTCLSGFNMFRLHIDAMTGEIFKEENKNLMDIVRIEKKGDKKQDGYIG